MQGAGSGAVEMDDYGKVGAEGAEIFDRKQQRLRKKGAVLKAAATAFNRRGFANTSMDDVAAALGISKPALYQYFRSKQEILYECHLLAIKHGEAGVEEARAIKGTGFEKVLTYLRRYMRGFFDELGGFAVLLDVHSLSEEHRDEVLGRRKAITNAVERLVKSGIKDGSIVQCDAKLAALFAFGVINWISVWYHPGGPRTPQEIIAAFTFLFRNAIKSVE
jgi:AcrR family transcriptional regulator